jgi:hypothetical protein
MSGPYPDIVGETFQDKSFGGIERKSVSPTVKFCGGFCPCRYDI